MTSEQFLGLYNYWIVIFLMMTGFYIVIARKNMIKTIIGLNIFQTSVFLLYITMGKVRGGTAPIISPDKVADYQRAYGHHGSAHADGHAAEQADAAHAAADSISHTGEQAGEHAGLAGAVIDETIYSNPLPSVLMLTAIVVGIATTALALALIVRIHEEYGTIEEDEILLLERES